MEANENKGMIEDLEEMQERQRAEEYERFRRSNEKKAENKFLRFLKKPFSWVKRQFEKIGNFIAFRIQPKEVRKEMLAVAYKEAEEEYAKEKESRFSENVEVSNKKMAIVREEDVTNAEKLKALSNLCFESGRTFTVATQNGAFMFEKEANTVRIMYADKIYRTQEEREEGIARYSFKNSTIGGIVYNKRGKQLKEDFGLFDAVNKMSNEKDSFDFSTRNIAGVMETEGRVIAEADVPQVDIVHSEEQDKKLDEAILSGDREEIKKVLDANFAESKEPGYGTPLTLDELARIENIDPETKKMAIEEEKFRNLPNYLEEQTPCDESQPVGGYPEEPVPDDEPQLRDNYLEEQTPCSEPRSVDSLLEDAAEKLTVENGKKEPTRKQEVELEK